MSGRPIALCVATLALAATAGCASPGHTAPTGQGGGGELDASAADQASPEAGIAGATAAPAPIGTALISNSAVCAPAAVSVGPSPLRRISRVEYDNMVRDLLQDKTQPAINFVSESPPARGINFDTNTYTTVSSTLIPQQYLDAAEALAATAVTANNLNNVTGCSQPTDDCASLFISHFANRAFRGQLDAAESASLFQIYSDVKTQFDFATGIQAIITAVLTSPRFLFVFEFGQGGTPNGNATLLAPYEVAARLSLFLWRSVPDDALMQAAAAGQLGTPDQVAAQALRMLADPKAVDALDDFATQWMELENTDAVTKDTQFSKQASSAKNWTPQLAHDLKTETLATFSSVTLTENGGLTQLLTSPASYVSQSVADFYGVPLGTGKGIVAGFFKTDVTAAHRAGILTGGGVLATQAHPSLPSSVLRGKLVREELLCDAIAAPPPNVPSPPTTVDAGTTTRDLFNAHATKAPCIDCHTFMDPIGFAFGNFDAAGAYQTTDANGQTSGTFPPIDATGHINPVHPGDLDAPLDGAVDLAQKLGASVQVEQCFALQEIRYALGRIESNADACSAQQVFKDFASSHFNIQKLIVAIVRSDAFRYRTVVTAGSVCQ